MLPLCCFFWNRMNEYMGMVVVCMQVSNWCWLRLLRLPLRYGTWHYFFTPNERYWKRNKEIYKKRNQRFFLASRYSNTIKVINLCLLLVLQAIHSYGIKESLLSFSFVLFFGQQHTPIRHLRDGHSQRLGFPTYSRGRKRYSRVKHELTVLHKFENNSCITWLRRPSRNSLPPPLDRIGHKGSLSLELRNDRLHSKSTAIDACPVLT